MRHLGNTIAKLNNLVVQVQKKLLHDGLVKNIQEMKDLQQKKLNTMFNGDLAEFDITLNLIKTQVTSMQEFALTMLKSES